MIKYIKKYIFPVLVIIGAIVDISTNLFKDFFTYMDTPLWVSTGLRILIAMAAIARLYYTIVSLDKNKCNDKTT